MNITPGTALWAIQQMLNGKKIRYKEWLAHDYIHVVDGYLVSCKGNLFSVLAMEQVSDNKGWLIWTAPNPYPKGTFAWAWEELQRGNKVVIQHGDFSIYYWKKDTDYYAQIANSEPGVAVSVMLSDINSTKWELVE